jgi:class 3 adenylate cyclase
VLRLFAADHASVALQPSGTVTFVFTDIEGSTVLLDNLGAEAFKEALADHRRALREAFGAHAGYEVDEAGDGLFYPFASASEAVTAVAQAMASLADGRCGSGSVCTRASRCSIRRSTWASTCTRRRGS